MGIGKDAQIELDEHRAYDLTKAVMAMNAGTDDAQEGMSPFLEKRPTGVAKPLAQSTWRCRSTVLQADSPTGHSPLSRCRTDAGVPRHFMAGPRVSHARARSSSSSLLGVLRLLVRPQQANDAETSVAVSERSVEEGQF